MLFHNRQKININLYLSRKHKSTSCQREINFSRFRPKDEIAILICNRIRNKNQFKGKIFKQINGRRKYRNNTSNIESENLREWKSKLSQTEVGYLTTRFNALKGRWREHSSDNYKDKETICKKSKTSTVDLQQ